MEDTPHDAMQPESSETLSLRRSMHRTIQRVTTDLDDLQFNTMVAAMIEFTNELQGLRDSDVTKTTIWREALEALVLMMAPSTPYVAEELWERLGKPYSVHHQDWPVFSADLAREETVELVLQVNGKLRDKVSVPADLSEARARELAFASGRVQDYLGGKVPERVIYVPGKLVNIVIR